ncbi:Tetratricopeptide repeat protein [Seminavis robusta]|uniref:Tetratricopeptide repeat protein n=1 Tax=Seminavis robusta TaxID=568900 RepID=A0A9N8H8G6_9STRA|nr:Tetratricopeptide repeat protein [Seminavis robusta]|eukprot:Sro159_g071980.1 Tetratricopeptide repeat protein (451) ;mRNA; f:99039-100483
MLKMPEATLSPTSVVTTPSSTATNAASSCPASVAMVHSSSQVALLPSGAATVTSDKQSTASTAIFPKPFFVMDWLEEINPRDLELARQMLQTPTKKKGRVMSSPMLQHQPKARTESPPTSRSAINLPTLRYDDKSACSVDDSNICRQLYPPEQTPPSSTVDTTTSTTKEESEEEVKQSISSTNVTTTTESTADATPQSPQQATNAKSATPPAAAKMSPFRKRSIAIGNGWNAKGLHKAKKGSWEKALACWENALVIRTQVLGETHPDVANTCNNIGIALGKLGRYDSAIEILEKALEMRAKHYGTREHVEVATTLHNIGNVLHAAQDWSGAIQCFWDAKLLQEQLLGPNHIQVARACVAIANVYNEALQYQDAMEAYTDALQIFHKAGLGDDNPEVTSVQQDLLDVERRFSAHQQSMAYNNWRQYYNPAAIMAHGSQHYQQQGRNLQEYR